MRWKWTMKLNGKRKTLVLEVQQHIGDGWVRAVAMSSTDGLAPRHARAGYGAPH